MVQRLHERTESRISVRHLNEHKWRPRRMDIDAVTHHRARIERMAEAGPGPHLAAVERPGNDGEEAEPGEAGEAVVGPAAAPEGGDGDRDGGDVIAEGEEGLQVWGVHAARAAAALAGPDEVVELARFGALVGCCFGGGGAG